MVDGYQGQDMRKIWRMWRIRIENNDMCREHDHDSRRLSASTSKCPYDNMVLRHGKPIDTQ
jgi:hypothetical protein